MLSLSAWKRGLTLPQPIVPGYIDSSWKPLPMRRSGLSVGYRVGEGVKGGGWRSGRRENCGWNVK